LLNLWRCWPLWRSALTTLQFLYRFLKLLRQLIDLSRKFAEPGAASARSQSTFKFECKGPRAHEASGGGLLAKSRFALRNVVPSFVLDFWIGRRCQAVRQLTNSPVESSAISSPHRLQLNRHVIVAGFRQGHRQSYPPGIPCRQVTIFRSGVRVRQPSLTRGEGHHALRVASGLGVVARASCWLLLRRGGEWAGGEAAAGRWHPYLSRDVRRVP
jgi:hypothetical protein